MLRVTPALMAGEPVLSMGGCRTALSERSPYPGVDALPRFTTSEPSGRSHIAAPQRGALRRKRRTSAVEFAFREGLQDGALGDEQAEESLFRT